MILRYINLLNTCKLKAIDEIQVIKHVLEVCKSADPKVEINKKLLLEIAEDHQYPEDVKNIIFRTCD